MRRIGRGRNPLKGLEGKQVAFLGLVFVLALVLVAHLRAQPTGQIVRVSVGTGNVQANGDSFFPSISADGHAVAFKSDATNLADPTADQHQFDDYVHYTDTGETIRVSVDPLNQPGNDNSFPPGISDDGQLVAFVSKASTLLGPAMDSNGSPNVFVRDVPNTTTQRISISDNLAISGGATEQDRPPSISSDGRFVAFESAAPLVPDQDPHSNPIADVFVYDRFTQHVELISRRTVSADPAPAFAPAISGDGCVVAFVSPSDRLVSQSLDTNEKTDVYARNRCGGTPAIEIVSVNRNGKTPAANSQASGVPALNADGNLVVFESDAIDLLTTNTNGVNQIFLRDRAAETTELISVNTYGDQGNDASSHPSISGDGRYVVFASVATNFVANDSPNSDIYIRDRATRQVCRVSVGPSLGKVVGDSFNPVISRDGQWIAFESTVENLVDGDNNGRRDIFIVPNSKDLQDCPPLPTPTPNDILDCCQCTDPLCQKPVGNACPQPSCDVITNAACLPSGCVPFTPTPTPGANDCCQCTDSTCQLPADGQCPDTCPPVFSALCADGGCVTFTPTPTPGANDCCQCGDSSCQAPADGHCPDACPPVFQAGCESQGCVTFTPTPTPGPSDCCACPDDACEGPQGGVCRDVCNVVFQAVCQAAGCATFTPTQTPTVTPTPGQRDCCQCPDNACEPPDAGTCRAECNIVVEAACLGGGCATFTPTPTPTITPTPGQKDCCQCVGTTCEAPTGGSCGECDVVFDAACQASGCVTHTPTITPTQTPIPGPRDCCQCSAPNPVECVLPTGSGCPVDCPPVFEASCQSNGCVLFTPSATRTATSTPTQNGGGATRTPTFGGGTPTPTSGTTTPTRTRTPGNGGGGGGCGCEIHPQPRNRVVLVGRDALALLGPMALVVWRHRRRRDRRSTR